MWFPCPASFHGPLDLGRAHQSAKCLIQHCRSCRQQDRAVTISSAFVQAYRNSVPVPRHWSQKRKYLQGKRGIEKPMFKLPEYIEATGIGEMRQAYHEKVH